MGAVVRYKLLINKWLSLEEGSCSVLITHVFFINNPHTFPGQRIKERENKREMKEKMKEKKKQIQGKDKERQNKKKKEKGKKKESKRIRKIRHE